MCIPTPGRSDCPRSQTPGRTSSACARCSCRDTPSLRLAFWLAACLPFLCSQVATLSVKDTWLHAQDTAPTWACSVRVMASVLIHVFQVAGGDVKALVLVSQQSAFVQALPNWLAEMQISNLDISFCKACNIDVVSKMTSLSVLCLQVGCLG